MPILILFLTSTITSALAQEASIPDPGLNAAIRQALQKPNGPLTEHDLLSLTNLTARGRNISSVAGLELARNLALLDLQFNTLTNFVLPGALTNLDLLDLGFNPLTQCSVPSGLTNLSTVIIEGSLLTDFRLPAGMRNLTSLFLLS